MRLQMITTALILSAFPSPSPSPSPAPTTTPPSNTYDVAAVGATVTGRVGDVVQISVGMKNLGPAVAPGHFSAFGPVQGFRVVLPSGTEVVGDPGGCATPPQNPELGGSADGCFVQAAGLPSGESIILVLNLRITDASPGAGTVHRTYRPFGTPDREINAANNSASIVVKAIPGLPVTGPKVSMTAAIGAGAVVIGGLLLMLARRRRSLA